MSIPPPPFYENTDFNYTKITMMTQKHASYSARKKWTAWLLSATFTLCLLTGLTQRIYGVIAAQHPTHSCCNPISNACHSQGQDSPKGFCTSEKVSPENSSHHYDAPLLIGLNGIRTPALKIDTQPKFRRRADQMNPHENPPHYKLRYAVNAPPAISIHV